MMKKYLIERLSWVLFFCCLQGLLLLIGYLDPSINLNTIIYIVFLSMIIFILFFIIRYKKETTFYKMIEETDPFADANNIQEGRTPFEKIVESAWKEQLDIHRWELNDLGTSVEREKEELLSWLHEVKTPLTTMKLMLERVEDRTLKRQLMYEWLRIHLLLDQQLHSRRISFMENDIYIEKVNLEKIIVEEIRMLQSWCMQKGIGFDVSLEIQLVLSDGKWLQFILRQLLTNAVKYSEGADIVIRSMEKDGRVLMEVQDYGRGIKSKDIPRIFDRGFTSTMDHMDHAATGMGLFLAKKAAESLKIHIDVESVYREGTIFTLTFPRKNEFNELSSM
ncbi:ATP-binding protein [Ornithinibacillus bavariensis]|uniref:ATP-binding protein n=1 Tax=Ornithinibacillus bavariensis TaxID=545502 RepID=UPI000EC41080|nr:histidine kinase [Ornithinibacillus sp.]